MPRFMWGVLTLMMVVMVLMFATTLMRPAVVVNGPATDDKPTVRWLPVPKGDMPKPGDERPCYLGAACYGRD